MGSRKLTHLLDDAGICWGLALLDKEVNKER